MFIIAMLVLVGNAYGESIVLGNYTINFDYNKPHEIVSVDQNISELNTFYGTSFFSFQYAPVGSFANEVKYQRVNISNSNAWLIIDQYDYFVAFPDNPIIIYGQMPFMDLANFLRTIKITEPPPSSLP